MKPKLIVFLLLNLMFIVYGCTNQSASSTKPSVTITKAMIDICEQDSDCIVVDYDGCCSSKIAINKKYREDYVNHPEWQKDNVDCAVVECMEFSNKQSSKCLEDSNSIERCTLA